MGLATHAEPRQLPTRQVNAVGAILATAFALLPGFALVMRTGDSSKPGFAWLSASLAAASALLCFSAANRGELFRSLFYLFCYAFVFLPWAIQLDTGMYPMRSAGYEDGTVTTAFILAALGAVAFEVGYHWRAAFVRKRERRFAINQRALRVVTVAAVGAVVVTLAIGGVKPFLTSRYAVSETFLGARVDLHDYDADNTGGTFLLFCAQVPIAIAIFGWLSLRSTGRVRWTMGLAVVVALALVVNNPISSSRLWTSALVLGVCISVGILTPQRGLRATVFGLLLASVFLFVFLDPFRGQGNEWHTLGDALRLDSMTSDNDYSQSQQFLNAVEYVDDEGYRRGGQLVGALGVFVPRRLWPDKPIDTGNLIQGPDSHINPSSSLWVEGFVDFGLAGAVLYLFGFGVASHLLDLHWRRGTTARSSPGGRLIAASIAGLFTFVLRGALQPAIGWLLPVAAVLIITIREVRDAD